jgi:hypothetical protein
MATPKHLVCAQLLFGWMAFQLYGSVHVRCICRRSWREGGIYVVAFAIIWSEIPDLTNRSLDVLDEMFEEKLHALAFSMLPAVSKRQEANIQCFPGFLTLFPIPTQ